MQNALVAWPIGDVADMEKKAPCGGMNYGIWRGSLTIQPFECEYEFERHSHRTKRTLLWMLSLDFQKFQGRLGIRAWWTSLLIFRTCLVIARNKVSRNRTECRTYIFRRDAPCSRDRDLRSRLCNLLKFQIIKYYSAFDYFHIFKKIKCTATSR